MRQDNDEFSGAGVAGLLILIIILMVIFMNVN